MEIVMHNIGLQFYITKVREQKEIQKKHQKATENGYIAAQNIYMKEVKEQKSL